MVREISIRDLEALSAKGWKVLPEQESSVRQAFLSKQLVDTLKNVAEALSRVQNPTVSVSEQVIDLQPLIGELKEISDKLSEYQRPKTWRFTIHRDTNNQIKEVTAEAV